MKELINKLKKINQSMVLLDEKLLILPFGGRVIGLAPDKINNLLWVNNRILSIDSSKEFFTKPGWVNIGGDRTWISPEVDTNIDNSKKANDTYNVQKSMDPAAYKILKIEKNKVVFETEMNLLFHRIKEYINITIRKNIELCSQPPFKPFNECSYAGYIMKSSLKYSGNGKNNVNPAIWNILQVQGNGKIIIPIRHNVKPKDFINKSKYHIRNNTLITEVKTSTSFKFSIKANNSLGIMLYENLNNDPAFIIVRKFSVYDESEYYDVSVDDLNNKGYVQQVYVDDGKLGGFGEMEYHSPAVSMKKGNEISDISEVWAFMGNKNEIIEIKNKIIEDYK